MTVPRPTLIADSAIAVIAERGLRGLTHRAVDEAAGLPTGSTSNLARTRSALLELALTRIAELEAATLGGADGGADGGPAGADGSVDGGADGPVDGGADAAPVDGASARAFLVDVVAEGLHQALTVGRGLTVARIELALEAARRPELRTLYDRLGAGFLDVAVRLLERCGSAHPTADARRLVRWCEGVLFNGTAGSGHAHPPTRRELAADAERYVAALLD